MSDQEEYLGDSDAEEAPPPKRENSTIKQMRETLDTRETRIKELEERNARFEATFITQSGLSEKQAAAMRASGYEVSPEGIESFRSEVLGVVEAPAAEEPQSESAVELDEGEDITPEQAGFVPTPTGGGTPSRQEMTSNEVVELMKTDPVKATKLLREGRVARKEFNPGGPAF